MTLMTAQPMTNSVLTIIFTVTNDLTYERRMHRICGTLATNGYTAQLIGRELPESIPLEHKPFGQKRLRCFFNKGFSFYAEYNLRLFFFLLFAKYDAVCSIDLDTLPAGCFATLLRGKKRVFDAHEYFTEVPEVVGRPFVKGFWAMVARVCLPFYKHAYTVGPELAKIFEKKYRLKFGVVRNVAARASPSLDPSHPTPPPTPPLKGRGDVELSATLSRTPLPFRGGVGGGVEKDAEKVLLYLGALNEGRGLEQAIETMQHLDNVQLWLAGEGDLSDELRQLAVRLSVEDKVTFLGYVQPGDIPALVVRAWLGLNLFENLGLSYYYSLANKFFVYVQAGVPMLSMNFPEYHALNTQHEVAILLDKLSPEAVAEAVKKLLADKELFARLQKNCLVAREEWNWEGEQETLLKLWRAVFTK